jgi:hypothetical protein
LQSRQKVQRWLSRKEQTSSRYSIFLFQHLTRHQIKSQSLAQLIQRAFRLFIVMPRGPQDETNRFKSSTG